MGENILQNKKIFLVGLLFITLIGAQSIEKFIKKIETASSEENAIEQIIEKVDKLEEKVVFTEYLITEKENKFYIKPEIWNKLTLEERQTALYSASRTVLYDKMLNYDFETLRSEQIKTKIFSSLNKDEILAYIAIEEILNKKGKIKRNKRFSEAYRFNDATGIDYSDKEIEIDAVINIDETQEYE